MDRHTPPSPAPTKAESLPSGFTELLRHNNNSASYSRQTIPTEPSQAHSQPASRYGTPGPQPHHSQGGDASVAYQQRGGGGDMHPAYQQHEMYQQDNSVYGPIPEPQPYSTPATSPPTPARGLDVMATRSNNARGEIVAKALGPRSTRIEKSTPKKKKERAKPPKNMPVLDKPMSELTKNSSIPVADIDTYVHRSSDIRRQEIETGKTPGRVKRPMNAFMLYRKAYQQRAKEWASQHNHQIVSRVCGMSWPLEPEVVRQQFKTWADTERDNHQKAHPNYKFAPSKPQKPPKFEGGFDDRSEGSDLEDFDWASRAGPSIRSATHTPGADRDYISSRGVYPTHEHPQVHQLAGMHAVGMQHHTRLTALDFSHAGKPLPGAYGHRDQSGQYFDAHMRNQQRRHLHHGVLEDVLVRRTPSPSLAFQHQQHQQSNAAGQHQQPYDMSQYHHKVEQQLHPQHQHLTQQQHQHQQHPAHHFEHRIDPSLMPQEEPLFDAGTFNSLPSMFDSGLGGAQQAWQTTSQLAAATEHDSQFSHAFMGLDETLSLEQHTQFLRGADEWQVEALPETGHFDTSWVEPKDEP